MRKTSPYTNCSLVHSLTLVLSPLFPHPRQIFAIVPLSFEEWLLVLAFSFPVIVIDELLKVAGRQMNAAEDKMRASAGTSAEVADEEEHSKDE